MVQRNYSQPHTFSSRRRIKLALLTMGMILIATLALTSCGLFGRGDSDEEEPTPAPVAAVSPEAVSTPAPAAGDEVEAGDQAIALSPDTGAPGATVTVEGEGWPAGRRVIISLVPVEPPSFTINSAVVDDDGRFAVDIIVPSDPRWLDESPVPVLAQLDDESLSAQALLVIRSPDEAAPVVTPAAEGVVVIPVVIVRPPAPPPPAQVARLTTTANLNVRTGPGVNYSILGVLLYGQQAEIVGRNSDATWWQIKFEAASQGVGWVSAAYATAENISNVPVVPAPPAPPPPPPTPTPQPTPDPTWLGQYYDNPDLSGAPVLVRNDPAISFDWGYGSPDPQVPVDNFSARWTRTINFPAGVYRFYSRTDDGVRLWVDGALLIDRWVEQSPTTYAADIYLSEGPHYLRMEYFERTLGAVAVLSWQRVDLYPDWKTEYYDNPDLLGSPILVRNEPGVYYDWGNGSPAPGIVPEDNFSARWTRLTFLEGGDYVFGMRSDDGARVWLNNDLLIDNWQDGDSGWIEVERFVPTGQHEFRIEYYERTGIALAQFTWQLQARPETPPLAVIGSPSESVVGQPVTFDGRRSRPGDNDIIRYEWDFGNGAGSSGDRISYTYRDPGEYRVRLTVTDRKGLQDRTSVRLRILQDPQETTPPIARISGPTTGKEGRPVTFDGSRSTSLSPIISYEWSFGDGTSATGQQISHVFNQAGLYNVRLTVVAQNGLRGSDNLQIEIERELIGSAPVARIVAPGVGEVGQQIDFDGQTSTASSRIVSYAWNFGDGSTANGLVIPHAFERAGIYNVILTVTDENGRSGQDNHQIQVIEAAPPDAPPVADFVGPDQALVGETVQFDASSSQPPTIDEAGFVWSLGDGATASGRVINHVYSSPGDYAVELTVIDADNRSDTASDQIRVDPQPAPPVAVISGPTEGVVGQTVEFSIEGSQASNPLVGIDWDLGDGATAAGEVVSHAYGEPGAYNVTLRLTDQEGQEGAAQQSIQIDPAGSPNPPVAVINAPAMAETGQPVTFDGSGSTGENPLATFAWDFGDGSQATGQVVEYAYSQPGDYNVSLSVTDDQGLVGSASVQIQVSASVTLPEPPQASISAPEQANVGDVVQFDGSGSVVPGQAGSYDWIFGDGAQGSGVTAQHAYSVPGVYNVTLTVSNESGSETASHQITIPEPEPVQPLPEPPEPVQPLPEPEEPALLPQPPVAVIEAPEQVEVGQVIRFDAGFSQGEIIDFAWDFGDGMTGSGMGVDYSYGAPGLYNVSLTVTDQNGLSDTAGRVVQVNPPAVQPQPVEPAPEQPVEPAPEQPAEPVEPPPPPEPEPEQPAEPAPEQPVEPAPEQPAPEQPVEPAPEPEQPAEPAPPAPGEGEQPVVIQGPPQVEVNQEASFNGIYGPGSAASYAWDFGDGTPPVVIDLPTAAHAYGATGVYTVTLTVTDQDASIYSATAPVQVLEAGALAPSQ